VPGRGPFDGRLSAPLWLAAGVVTAAAAPVGAAILVLLARAMTPYPSAERKDAPLAKTRRQQAQLERQAEAALRAEVECIARAMWGISPCPDAGKALERRLLHGGPRELAADWARVCDVVERLPARLALESDGSGGDGDGSADGNAASAAGRDKSSHVFALVPSLVFVATVYRRASAERWGKLSRRGRRGAAVAPGAAALALFIGKRGRAAFVAWLGALSHALGAIADALVVLAMLRALAERLLSLSPPQLCPLPLCASLATPGKLAEAGMLLGKVGALGMLATLPSTFVAGCAELLVAVAVDPSDPAAASAAVHRGAARIALAALAMLVYLLKALGVPAMTAVLPLGLTTVVGAAGILAAYAASMFVIHNAPEGAPPRRVAGRATRGGAAQHARSHS
jgi:hypothetical protein